MSFVVFVVALAGGCSVEGGRASAHLVALSLRSGSRVPMSREGETSSLPPTRLRHFSPARLTSEDLRRKNDRIFAADIDLDPPRIPNGLQVSGITPFETAEGSILALSGHPLGITIEAIHE